MEVTAEQMTSLVGKWLLLEAQYRDAQTNANSEHYIYEHEDRMAMANNAAKRQRVFEDSILEIFGRNTLDVVQRKGGESIKAIVKGA